MTGAGGTGADEEDETRLAGFSSTGDSIIVFSLTTESISLQGRVVWVVGEGKQLNGVPCRAVCVVAS
jgi:hypothetical protein